MKEAKAEAENTKGGWRSGRRTNAEETKGGRHTKSEETKDGKRTKGGEAKNDEMHGGETYALSSGLLC